MKKLRGYVATLDVLGFSELLQREGYEQELRTYLTCVDEVIRPAMLKTECVLFSDSIVLTSPGEDDEAFDNMTRACSAAFRALLKNDIPVRGAIALGSYWREARGRSVFLAGRPIVEAYQCERSSDWVGILLCSSVVREHPDLPSTTALPDAQDLEAWEGISTKDLDETFGGLARRVQFATVPYLDADTRTVGELSGYAVVPIGADDNDFVAASRAVGGSHNALERLRLKASQPRAQAKYQASLKWLGNVQKQFAGLSAVYRRLKKSEGSR